MSFSARLLAVAVVISLAAPARADEPKGGPEPFKHLKYPLDRPGRRRPRRPRLRRARRSAHLLRRHGGRRRLEVDRRRHSPGSRSSTISPSPPSAPSPSPRPTRTSSTSAPARPTSAATSRPATASTNRPTPARPGSTSGSRTARSARWSSIRRNPDIAFAAVLGHAFGPNAERGVYRTTDGGKTWQQVLKKDADTGAIDVVLRPVQSAHPLRRPVADPAPAVGADQRRPRQRPVRLARRRRHLEAARPPRRTTPTRQGAPGKGLAGGHLGQGRRRRRPVRRPARLRPDRGGEGRPVPLRRRRRDVEARQRDHDLRQRAWYFSTLTVDPTNPDVV